MKIKLYAFRLVIAVITFLLGFYAYRGFQKLERISPPNVASAGSANIAHKSETFYNLTGKYYLSEESFPRGFTDFRRLEIETHNDDSKVLSNVPRTPIPPKGAVQTDREYKFRSIAVNREFLVFETEEQGGISYRFAGRVREADERDGNNRPESGIGDIIGRLEKLQKGTAIASMETTFYLFGN